MKYWAIINDQNNAPLCGMLSIYRPDLRKTFCNQFIDAKAALKQQINVHKATRLACIDSNNSTTHGICFTRFI